MPYGTDPTTPPQSATKGGYGKDPTERPSQEEPSRLDALWASLKGLGQGATQTALGYGQAALGRRGAQPGARSPGETMAQQWLGQKSAASQQAYEQDPQVQRNPIAAGVSNIVGQVGPAMMMGGGMPAMKMAQSGLSRLAGGGLGGAAGAMSSPVPAVDYYKEKLAQLGPAAGVGAAIPGLGGMLSPRLPSMMAFNQKIQGAFRPLYDFLQGSEERTKEGFARTVGREALAPIGGKIEGRTQGSDLFESMRDQFDKAYDTVLPNIMLTGGHMQALPIFIATMGPESQRFFRTIDLASEQNLERMWNGYVTDRFNQLGGVIDGSTFKRMQSDISEYAWRKLKEPSGHETGQGAIRLLSHLNDAMVQQNPNFGPQLQKINSGWRVYALMRSAASGRDAQFKFGPSDLQGALNKASTDEQWVSANSVLRLYTDAAKNRMTSFSGNNMLPALLSRHGLPMELARGSFGPAGRALKTTAPATAPAAGRETENVIGALGP